MKKLFITLLGLTIISAAYAQTNGYVGASYLGAEYSENGFADVDLNGFRFFGGVPVNEYFAIEGMFSYATGDETISGIDVDLSGYMLSLFAKGILPVSEYFSFYGLVGVSHGSLEADVSGFGTVDEDDSSLSYGVGAEVNIADNLAAHLDYIMYLNKSDYDVGGFAVGLTYKF